MTKTPTLTALGIVLRPLVPTDAPALFVALSDPQVQLYRRAPAHTSLAESEAYIAETLAKSRAAWAITTDGSEALGRLALRLPKHDVGEFGIVIRAAAQGRGLGLKAIKLAEAFAFNQLETKFLRATIDTENAASKALFARAGFREVAQLAAARVTAIGSRDSVVMEKVRA